MAELLSDVVKRENPNPWVLYSKERELKGLEGVPRAEKAVVWVTPISLTQDPTKETGYRVFADYSPHLGLSRVPPPRIMPNATLEEAKREADIMLVEDELWQTDSKYN